MQKWFVKLYIPAMVLFITAGMAFVLYYGYKPQPTVIMKPSEFSSPEEIGAAAFRRFYYPISEAKLTAIGIPPQPDWHQKIVRGFISAANFEKVPFDLIIAEEQMPLLDLTGLPPIQLIPAQTNTDTQSEVVDAVHAAQASGKRILLYMPSVFSSHVIDRSALQRLEKNLGVGILGFTTGPLALRPDQEFIVDPPCLGSERDNNGTSSLGCLILQSGRGYYRKRVEQTKWVAIMNEPYPDNHMIMVSVPGQNSETSEPNKDLRMNAPKGKGAGF